MSDNKKVYVLGGGTVFHVRNHLALAAVAYGSTAKRLNELAQKAFPDMDVHLRLTRMAGGDKLETNEDVDQFVDQIIEDASTKVVFFNFALCDFTGIACTPNQYPFRTMPGKYAPRLQTRDEQDKLIELHPSHKIIHGIRRARKDITLVGFKTTCGASEDEQYIAGLNLLKEASCNLVLANDTKTRTNMVITPEEARYHVTTDREEALKNLVEMTALRSHLTFTRSTVVAGTPIEWRSTAVPVALRDVVNYCIKEGAYKPFRGATVGHFAAKIDNQTFITSRRKTNFNDIEKLGLVLIKTDGPDSVIAFGAKPSVGGQSQRIIFNDHPEYDCIVHFHCPIKPSSQVPTVSQREYECGSHECGKNTSKGLKEFTVDGQKFAAVYLDQHGPNIVFNRTINPDIIIRFIEENFDLKGKTGGYVALPAA